jgi:hypothetical protein
MRHLLSLPDCYLVLGVVHDRYRENAPILRHDEKGRIFYDAQLSCVWQLNEDDGDHLTLGDCLARVEGDLVELSPQLPVPPSGEVTGPTENFTPHPDGPVAPHWLWLANVRHRIGSGRSQLSWLLLKHFWNRDSATYEDLQGLDRPWLDPVDDSTVGTAVNRFNAQMPPGFPWKLITKNRCVAKESRENPTV